MRVETCYCDICGKECEPAYEEVIFQGYYNKIRLLSTIRCINNKIDICYECNNAVQEFLNNQKKDNKKD